MPDPEWKKEFWEEDWFLGDTYITAIGQGNVLMTPLQVHQMMSLVASGGNWCRPFLLKETGEDCQRFDIHEDSLRLVIKGLEGVTDTGGTAFPFFDYQIKGKRIKVGGKTGTAEFGDPDPPEGGEGKTHAWFTIMAPLENPEIVVTVLLEAAGQGSDQAAPVAKEVLDYWFSRQ